MKYQQFKTPGQYVKALMKARGWTQRTLAIILDIDDGAVNKIVNDKKEIEAEIALSLGEVFNVEPNDFLILQKDYDLAKAKLKRINDNSIEKRVKIFGELPLSEMVKRGWIPIENIRDTKHIEASLTKFFKSDSIDNIEILPHAARKTITNGNPNTAQIAWLYRVKAIAEEMLAGNFSKQAVLDAIGKLQNLLHAPEEIRKVPRILAECGIRFMLVEALPSSKIDGACLWLNERKPVIAMSMRHDRIDNFWFVLRHELEHVLQEHGIEKIMLDVDLQGEYIDSFVNAEEVIANNAASEFCVPQAKLTSFIARKSPFFRESDILGFSKTLHVHPGIVSGQLQHITGRYDRFRNHLVKVRHIIIPNAMVDGWGDIAPVDL